MASDTATFSTSRSQSGLQRRGYHRFGFNGKENDNEVKGTGNQQDYGMRIYDPRLGRFLSADPLIVQGQEYPWYSPYQFAGNKPIYALDLDGLEELPYILHVASEGPSLAPFTYALDWLSDVSLPPFSDNAKVDYFL
ncbi:MAG: hypothetical protein A2W93_09590 [Bacteroidetes bacterium GWF2_43_63]|nr:MAG: hypothetical protein A2W93_09590 [Bacteroidetes bacterium GWF2_43_63]